MYSIPLEDGEVRVFAPNEEEGDLSTMYIMDVFGVTAQIRLVEGGVFVAVINEGAPRRLSVDVNGTGAVDYGDE